MIRSSSNYLISLAGLAVLVLLFNAVAAEVLVNSGNPMKGGNAQRNRHTNRKLLCPEIAPGRTQIWNVAWKTQIYISGFYDTPEITQDEKGFIYVIGTDDGSAKYFKLNSTDGSLVATYNSTFFAYTVPTHIKGKMIFAAPIAATVVSSTTLQDLASKNWTGDIGYVAGSFAPYTDDIMVTSYGGLLHYFNVSSMEFVDLETNPPCSFSQDVIVHENNGTKIPIVICGGYQSPITVWSPNYNITIEDTLTYLNAYVQNDQLVIHGQSNTNGYCVFIYNAATGEAISDYVISYQLDATIAGVAVIGNKSIASVDAGIIDFMNNNTVLIEETHTSIMPTYSIPDNSVLISAVADYQQLISLDWDTQTVNAVGAFPWYAGALRSYPLVSDDCTVHALHRDSSRYSTVYTSKPLPISNIQPILECITDTGVGYFSYKNMEDIDIMIPYAKDRNNIMPMNIAGPVDFQANQRGKYFPLSTPIALDNNTSSFSWQLEDYILSFSNTKQVRCPQNVTMVLYFTFTTAYSDYDYFAEWIRVRFSSATSTNNTRVSVANLIVAGLNVTIQLQIQGGDFGDNLTPDQVARNLNYYQFGQDVSRFKLFVAYGLNLIDYHGVPLDTEIAGTIPPKAVPLAVAPTDSQAPTNSNNAPKSRVTSGGNIHVWSGVIGTIVVIISLFL